MWDFCVKNTKILRLFPATMKFTCMKIISIIFTKRRKPTSLKASLPFNYLKSLHLFGSMLNHMNLPISEYFGPQYTVFMNLNPENKGPSVRMYFVNSEFPTGWLRSCELLGGGGQQLLFLFLVHLSRMIVVHTLQVWPGLLIRLLYVFKHIYLGKQEGIHFRRILSR